MQPPAAPDPGGLPPVPAFDLRRAFDVRDRVRSRLAFGGFLGSQLEGPDLAALVAALARELPAPREAVRQSLGDAVGRFLDRRLGDALAARLAGNLPALRAGRPAPAWTPALARHWAAAQVVRVRWRKRPPTKWRAADQGWQVHLRLLAGPPAGLEAERFWGAREAQHHARVLGFGRRGSPLGYQDGPELFGLRLAVLVDPALSGDGRPVFKEVACPGVLKTHNKELIKLRRRRGFACPLGYQHSCAKCPIGYEPHPTADKAVGGCPAACHRYTYVWGLCPGCGDQWWRDPEADPKFCVRCRGKLDAHIPLPLVTPKEGPDGHAR